MIDKIDLIAYDAIKSFEADDLRIVSGELASSLPTVFDSSVTRWLRNEYSLWYDNPLTAKWRDHPETHKIIDGVDHSYDHPDAVSERIYQFMKKHLSFYTGRKVTVAVHKMSVAVSSCGSDFNADHPCVIVKRTKSGLIQVRSEKYPKSTISVTESEVIF